MKKLIATSSFFALALATPFVMEGCSRSIVADNVDFIVPTPVGPFRLRVEQIRLGPAEPPPAGLVFNCSVLREGKEWFLYTDPATGDQWIRDPDGDYHPNNGDLVPCPPVAKSGSDYTFSGAAYFSFDEAADLAHASFTLPAEAAALYQPASEMLFGVSESVISLYNGDINVSYTGTINDVLGAMWNLGFQEIAFNDKIGGMTTIYWIQDFNSVYIETEIGHQNIVLQATNLPES